MFGDDYLIDPTDVQVFNDLLSDDNEWKSNETYKFDDDNNYDVTT